MKTCDATAEHAWAELGTCTTMGRGSADDLSFLWDASWWLPAHAQNWIARIDRGRKR